MKIRFTDDQDEHMATVTDPAITPPLPQLAILSGKLYVLYIHLGDEEATYKEAAPDTYINFPD